MEEKAYFVKRPRRMDDLKTVHMLTAEEPYKIIRFVRQRGHTDGGTCCPGNGRLCAVCGVSCSKQIMKVPI